METADGVITCYNKSGPVGDKVCTITAKFILSIFLAVLNT